MMRQMNFMGARRSFGSKSKAKDTKAGFEEEFLAFGCITLLLCIIYFYNSRFLNPSGMKKEKDECSATGDQYSSQKDPGQKVFNRVKFETYMTFIIDGRQEIESRIGKKAVFLTLMPATQLDSGRILEDPYEFASERGIWSMKFNESDLGTTRFYILLPTLRNGRKELHLIFKSEDADGVSQSLFSRPIGARVKLRGPCPEVEIPRGDFENVIINGFNGDRANGTSYL